MGLEWELNTKDVSGPSQSLKDKAGFLNKFPMLLGDAWGPQGLGCVEEMSVASARLPSSTGTCSVRCHPPQTTFPLRRGRPPSSHSKDWLSPHTHTHTHTHTRLVSHLDTHTHTHTHTHTRLVSHLDVGIQGRMDPVGTQPDGQGGGVGEGGRHHMAGRREGEHLEAKFLIESDELRGG